MTDSADPGGGESLDKVSTDIAPVDTVLNRMTLEQIGTPRLGRMLIVVPLRYGHMYFVHGYQLI